MGGRNIFSTKIKDIQINDIEKLISLKDAKKQFYQNSIIDICSSKNERFFESFEINQFFNYYSDPLTKTTIISSLVDAKKFSELNYFIKQSLKLHPNK